MARVDPHARTSKEGKRSIVRGHSRRNEEARRKKRNQYLIATIAGVAGGIGGLALYREREKRIWRENFRRATQNAGKWRRGTTAGERVHRARKYTGKYTGIDEDNIPRRERYVGEQ